MQQFIVDLLICTITISALALLYILINPFILKKYSPKGPYYAWLIILVRLIIPFRLQIDNSIIVVDVPPTVPIISSSMNKPLQLPIGENAPFSLTNISWWDVLAVIWLIGMALFLIYHIIKHIRFIRMVNRWSDKITDQNVLTLFQQLTAEMKITKNVRLYSCPCVGSPTLIGFTNPCILLPQLDFQKHELRFILMHELVHYKRKDLWYKLLLLVATAIHWFNPIIYIIAREIGILCESSCDVAVVESADINTRQQYSETIIRVIRHQSKMQTALSTNFYGGKKGMKNRIISIMDINKKKAGLYIVCIVLIATIAMGCTLSANTSTDPASAESSVISTIGTGRGDITGYIRLYDGREFTYQYETEEESIVGVKQFLANEVAAERITQEEADAQLALLESQVSSESSMSDAGATISTFGTGRGDITGYIRLYDGREFTYQYETEEESIVGVKQFLANEVAAGRITQEEADAQLSLLMTD